MIGELVDNLVSLVSPQRGVQRAIARKAIDQLRSLDAGKVNRSMPRAPKAEGPNASNLSQLANARYRAWEVLENNPYAGKAKRQLHGRVIGSGISPQSAAVMDNEEAQETFRSQAERLWEDFSKKPDWLGAPGLGGRTLGEIQRQIITELCGNGEVFVRFRYVSTKEQERLGLAIPLLLELIEADRLVENPVGPLKPTEAMVFRGIEFDSSMRRVSYWVYKTNPHDMFPLGWSMKFEKIPANEVLHIFDPLKVGQIRGTPMFSSVIKTLQSVEDSTENEIMAGSVAACVSMVIKTMPGSGLAGLNPPTGKATVDEDGNRLKRLQPGAIFELNPGEDVVPFNPGRPNSQAEQFFNFLLRSISVGVPGIKSSSITSDYRSSSFSSEKSAENDCWREIEPLQDLVTSHFLQPVWEKVLRFGVIEGRFGGMRTSDFDRHSVELCRCHWGGPVPKSINPTDDENASALAIATGTSSLQRECSARGVDWKDILKEQEAVKGEREKLGLDPQPIPNALTSPAKAAGDQNAP